MKESGIGPSGAPLGSKCGIEDSSKPNTSAWAASIAEDRLMKSGRAGLTLRSRVETHLSGYEAGRETQKFLSFRSAGADRESGTH
jgi:hypothetical protein